MTALFRIALAIGLAGCIAGCAMPSPTRPSAVAPSLRTKVVSADRARHAVATGKSTKADVVAALGETLVISFDTGFEVWIYRLANDASGKEIPLAPRIARTSSEQAAPGTTAEFVILFAPSGLAVKTRIRVAPPPA